MRVEYLVEDTVQKHELSTVEDLPLHGVGFFEPLDYFEVRIPENYAFVGAPYRLLDEFNAPWQYTYPNRAVMPQVGGAVSQLSVAEYLDLCAIEGLDR